jgi:hypothetical protein
LAPERFARRRKENGVMRKQTTAALYVRAVVMGVAGLLCPPGCALSQFRQQAVEYSLDQAARSRDEIVSAVKATREIAEEVGPCGGTSCRTSNGR